MLDSYHLNSSSKEGGGSCGNDGVGRRGWPTSKENGDTLKMARWLGGWGECICHRDLPCLLNDNTQLRADCRKDNQLRQDKTNVKNRSV